VDETWQEFKKGLGEASREGAKYVKGLGEASRIEGEKKSYLGL